MTPLTHLGIMAQSRFISRLFDNLMPNLPFSTRWLVFFFLMTGSLVASRPAISQDRTWTDNTGKYSVEASFIAFKDGVVQLKKTSNGKLLSLPIERLSDADQQFVRQLMSELKKPKIAQSLKLSAQLRWSDLFELGEENKPIPTYLELVVTATGKDAKEALELGHLQLTELVNQENDALEQSRPTNQFFDLSKKFIKVKERGNGFFAKHPEDGVRCVFKIERPESQTKIIKSAKGSFKIKTGGTRNVVKVEKAVANLGKLESKVLDGLGLTATIDRPNAELLEVQISGTDPTIDLIVSVLDPEQQKLLDLNGFSERGPELDRTFSFSFKRAVPANATVYIATAQDTEVVTVPFSFSDLELPERK